MQTRKAFREDTMFFSGGLYQDCSYRLIQSDKVFQAALFTVNDSLTMICHQSWACAGQ